MEFPRLIAIPERTGCFMLAEELILHYLPLMFPGYRVVSKTLARITRSADIDADAVYRNKRIPTDRLLYRLDLKQYDVDAPMGPTLDCSAVRIPLRMHIGGPDTPLVSVGQAVTRGQLIAQPNGMGANIHASICGTVTAVTGDYIEIRK